jgi:hypothetical protein
MMTPMHTRGLLFPARRDSQSHYCIISTNVAGQGTSPCVLWPSGHSGSPMCLFFFGTCTNPNLKACMDDHVRIPYLGSFFTRIWYCGKKEGHICCVELNTVASHGISPCRLWPSGHSKHVFLLFAVTVNSKYEDLFNLLRWTLTAIC